MGKIKVRHYRLMLILNTNTNCIITKPFRIRTNYLLGKDKFEYELCGVLQKNKGQFINFINARVADPDLIF